MRRIAPCLARAAVIALATVLAGIPAIARAAPTRAPGRHPYFDDQGTIPWFVELGAAQDAARASGRLLFIEYGRRACPNCKTLVARVLPTPTVRPRIAASCVGLAADCDEPDPRVEDVFRRAIPDASLLPFVALVSPDLEVVASWQGAIDADGLGRALDRVDAFRARRARPIAAPLAPKPVAKAPAPSKPTPAAVPAPAPDRPPTPAVGAPARPIGAGPTSAPAPAPVPDPVRSPAPVAPPSPTRGLAIAPIGPPLVVSPPPARVAAPRATPPSAAATPGVPAGSGPVIASSPTPGPGSGPARAAELTPPASTRPAPSGTDAAPERQAPPLVASSETSRSAVPTTPVGAAEEAEESAIPASDAEALADDPPPFAARSVPVDVEIVVPSRTFPGAGIAGSEAAAHAAAKALLRSAIDASRSGDHAGVLRLDRECCGLPLRTEPTAWELLLVTADRWADGVLTVAAREADDGHLDGAERLATAIRADAAGRAASIDAERGLRAIERRRSLSAIPDARRGQAAADARTTFRGTRWERLFDG